MQIAIDWIRSQWTGGYIETSLLQREVRCRVTARSADTKKNLENVRTSSRFAQYSEQSSVEASYFHRRELDLDPVSGVSVSILMFELLSMRTWDEDNLEHKC